MEYYHFRYLRDIFISTTIINSLKFLNILSDKQTQNFLKSIKTITSEMITELEISKTDKKGEKILKNMDT